MSPVMTRRIDLLDDDACWQAVMARDAGQDGSFYFGVLTTGVFCKPSCAARRPLRKNVRFYAAPEAAERDGLRPCRRCRPLEGDGEMERRIEELCAFIRERVELGEALTMEVLARRAGLSASHLARCFRAVVGMTPRSYVEARRVEALKRGLRGGESVTGAIYDAGFGSASRVYERSSATLGMTPSQYRAGGRGIRVLHAAVETSLGWLLVAGTERGLCFVQFGASPEELHERLRQELPRAMLEAHEAPYPAPLEGWIARITAHLAGRQPELDLPTDLGASAFQLAVWSQLRSIPYGERRSYSEVAAALGRPSAARAVARACASNRAALVIPCHRVVRSDGELGGYRWGLERKRRLLEGEGAGRPV